MPHEVQDIDRPHDEHIHPPSVTHLIKCHLRLQTFGDLGNVHLVVDQQQPRYNVREAKAFPVTVNLIYVLSFYPGIGAFSFADTHDRFPINDLKVFSPLINWIDVERKEFAEDFYERLLENCAGTREDYFATFP